MKLTKYEHACFVVEHNEQSLVVDPGDFTTDFAVPDNVVAVVITHEHGDHLDRQKIQVIAERNQDVTIIAHNSITDQLQNFKTKAVDAGDTITLGEFTLEFYGGKHAKIIKDWEPIANLGVLINSAVYYPGDSFARPDNSHVEILALPAGAPWMKIAEAAEFLEIIKPVLAFPTHDAVLSERGKSSADKWLTFTAERIDTKYQRLIEPLEL